MAGILTLPGAAAAAAALQRQARWCVKSAASWEKRRARAASRRSAEGARTASLEDLAEGEGLAAAGIPQPAGVWAPERQRGHARRANDASFAEFVSPDGGALSAAHTEVSVERAYLARLEEKRWPSEIPLASPTGRMLSKELAFILHPNLYRFALNHVETTGTTFFAAAVIPMAYFPKLSYAYRRANVQPKSPNLTVLTWAFPSSPRVLYGVSSTSPRGALRILKDTMTRGTHLSNINVLLGTGTGRHYVASTGGEEGPDNGNEGGKGRPAERRRGKAHSAGAASSGGEDEYIFINRSRDVMHGPRESVLPQFHAADDFTGGGYTAEETLPPASYSTEQFNWGTETEAVPGEYFVPVGAARHPPAAGGAGAGDKDGTLRDGGYASNPYHALAGAAHSEVDDATPADRRARLHAELRGKASRLHYFAPDVALAAYEAEREGHKAFRTAVKEQAKVLQKQGLPNQGDSQPPSTPPPAFDSI